MIVQTVALAMWNTMMCGASSGLVALIVYRIRVTQKWSLLATINAVLAGMACACTACNRMVGGHLASDGGFDHHLLLLLQAQWAAVVTGLGAGLCYCALSALMVRARIDDPLDAVAVHCGGGLYIC
jgi:Amt family ammonium transporter